MYFLIIMMLPETVESLKRSITDFCEKTEGLAVTENTDSAGHPCLEWKTYLILEVVAGGGEKEEKSLSRQFVPAQFDVSFDESHHTIRVFLQWGRIDPDVWKTAEAEVRKELSEEVNLDVRFYEDRQVLELCLRYPFHEFDFSIVYEEIIGHFGLANAIFFKTSNDDIPSDE